MGGLSRSRVSGLVSSVDQHHHHHGARHGPALGVIVAAAQA